MHYPRKSYWHESANQIKKTLNKSNENINNKRFDILIIGGGLAGLTTAYLLRDSGYKIGVIEGSTIGYGTTGFTTAKLTVQHDIRYRYLLDGFGINKTKQYLKANEEGLNLIREIIKNNNIDCEYKDQTAYVYTTKEEEVGILKDEFEAYKRLQINGFYTENLDLPIKTLGAIGIKDQGQFNPLKYLYNLYNILLDSSVEIYENIRALNITPHSEKHMINTDKGDIYANKIIVTTHYPFDNDFGLFFLRLYQEKSYALAVKTHENPFEGMYINVKDPTYSLRYHYTDKGNFLILVGGNHRVAVKDNEEDSYNELENFLKENFKNYEIISKWSTQDCMTYDKIPYIGNISNNVENIYVATGFNKWGMTGTAAAALILKNKILGIKDDYSEIFDPSRITPILSAAEFFPTGAVIASGFMKRIKPSSTEFPDIEFGEGKIINYNGRKIGFYKDEGGGFFCINPVCTHLKCAVSFNDAEKTWDCQCHGSRFDVKGNILEGPAVYPLEKIKIDFPDSY
ncbi:MAG: FAD-dependent oxidoreductase [Tissierellia bacterium]|nr:FAD-dependent oxidoreductase [Tissierellia bacterium]MDD4781797.1 FAD-dependent oxidoreductase [Tissierellia bacterium]